MLITWIKSKMDKNITTRTLKNSNKRFSGPYFESNTIEQCICSWNLLKIKSSWRGLYSTVLKKYKKPHSWHLILYNPGLRISLKNPSGWNNGTYCPLHLCKKLGRSLEPFWRKGQKSKKKHTFFEHNSLQLGVKIFFRRTIWLKQWALLHSVQRGMIPPFKINPPLFGIPPFCENPYPPVLIMKRTDLNSRNWAVKLASVQSNK